MDPRSQIWKPLDATKRQIRLLVLAPSEDEDADLKGALITVSLEQHLFYDAISHAWGSPSQPEVVILNGIDWVITESLFDALTHLRHRDQERCFWVDALCINQFDIEERSSQVRLMEDIFHRAITVQVWLGRGDSRIVDFVKNVNEKAQWVNMFDIRLPESDYEHQEETLALLSGLTYFGRLWVIQEVALARDLRFIYDGQYFTAKKLMKLCARYYHDDLSRPRDPYHSTIMGRLFPVVHAPDHLKAATTGSVNHKVGRLLDMMQKSRQFECADPRDRIYGMLGIITAMFGPGFLIPQYSLSVADVYTEFAGKLISVTGSLMLLNQTETPCNSLALPSWVPDWSSNFSHHDAAYRQDKLSEFQACGDFSRHQSVTDATTHSFRVLIASGVLFDTVREVGRCARSISFYSDRKDSIRDSLESWSNMFPGPSINFATIVTLDQISPRPTLTEFYEALDTSVSEGSERIRDIKEFLDFMISGRRFFTTANGRAGLGPRDTKPGDQLAVLAGGNVPYVLRTRPDPKDPYIFIGESYVHGVMHGEAVKEAAFELREIKLE